MRFFTLLFLASLFAVSSAAAECQTKDVPIASKDASASVWDNMRNNAGSIRFESAQLLDQALKGLSKLEPPAGLCPNECGTPKPTLFFSSVPKKFRGDYSDKEKCTALESKTKTKPYEYRGKVFNSEDEFNSWFSDFSQGKGDEGSDLYDRCDGDCSPQYFTSLVPSSEKLLVDAEVVCGQARDKDDNNYVLKFAYRWSCVK